MGCCNDAGAELQDHAINCEISIGEQSPAASTTCGYTALKEFLVTPFALSRWILMMCT